MEDVCYHRFCHIDNLFVAVKGPIDCLKTTWKTEGIRGLYKGATPPLIVFKITLTIIFFSLLTLLD